MQLTPGSLLAHFVSLLSSVSATSFCGLIYFYVERGKKGVAGYIVLWC